MTDPALAAATADACAALLEDTHLSQPELQDDATALLVEWRRDTELALLPQTVQP